MFEKYAERVGPNRIHSEKSIHARKGEKARADRQGLYARKANEKAKKEAEKILNAQTKKEVETAQAAVQENLRNKEFRGGSLSRGKGLSRIFRNLAKHKKGLGIGAGALGLLGGGYLAADNLGLMKRDPRDMYALKG